MLKFLGPFNKYLRSDGGERGYYKKIRKRTRGGGSFKSIPKPIFFRGVISQLNYLFLFSTSLMGK